MRVPTNKEMRGKWRRVLFWAWVAASAAVGTYIGITGFFVNQFSPALPYVAYSVPALMIFLLATGLGWLILLVASRPRRQRGRYAGDVPRRAEPLR